MLLNGYLGQLGRTLDCGNREATKGWEGWLFFFSVSSWEIKKPGPTSASSPSCLRRDKRPCSCMPEAFPLAFVVYFAGKKKKKRVGGVRLMRRVWVISHSNHRHWQWQDLSACVIVHCFNSLSLKFSACIMFLKIHHGNIKDLMQCFV